MRGARGRGGPIARLVECKGETQAESEKGGLAVTMVGHGGDGKWHRMGLDEATDRGGRARAGALARAVSMRAMARGVAEGEGGGGPADGGCAGRGSGEGGGARGVGEGGESGIGPRGGQMSITIWLHN